MLRLLRDSSDRIDEPPEQARSLAETAPAVTLRAVMPPTETTLRIPLAAALRHPGNSRPVTTAVGLAELNGVAAEIPVSAPVDVDLVLERVPEGIVVRGTLSADWTAACSRCLEPVDGRVSVHVDELFEPIPLEGETYLLGDDVIDLEPMVRDALLLELPLAPLCRDDCAGLCPTCGANRNDEPCDCAGEEPDPRWAALRSLEI
jgi:uncharacterized protein